MTIFFIQTPMDCSQNSHVRWYNVMSRKDTDDKTPAYKILDECYTRDELSRKVIISREVMLRSGKKTRNFAVFDNHIDLYSFIRGSDEEDRLFHEIVVAGNYQKPRFDVDIEKEEYDADPKAKEFGELLGVEDGSGLQQFGQYVKDRVIDASMAVLARNDIHLNLSKNIIVCSSHRSEKNSYHIIINGYMHSCEDEAKAFYEEVMKVIEDKEMIGKYIDHQVYSKNQPFRMLWSHKLGKKNTKVFEQEWLYNGDVCKYEFPPEKNPDHLNIMMLEACMLTFTSSCQILPYYEKESARNWDVNTVLTDDQSLGAFELLRDNWVANQDKNPLPHITDNRRMFDCPVEFQMVMPFKVRYIRGGFIALERLRESLCPICEVIHQNIDPYMFIIKGKVYFNCRRSEKYKGKKTNLFLGTVPWIDTSTGEGSWAESIATTEGTTADDDAWEAVTQMVTTVTHTSPTIHTNPLSQSSPFPLPSGPLFSPPLSVSSSSLPSTPVSSSPSPRAPFTIPLITPYPTNNMYPSMLSMGTVVGDSSAFNLPRQTAAEKVEELSRMPPPKTTTRRRNIAKKYAGQNAPVTKWSSGPPEKKNQPFM